MNNPIKIYNPNNGHYDIKSADELECIGQIEYLDWMDDQIKAKVFKHEFADLYYLLPEDSGDGVYILMAYPAFDASEPYDRAARSLIESRKQALESSALFYLVVYHPQFRSKEVEGISTVDGEKFERSIYPAGKYVLSAHTEKIARNQIAAAKSEHRIDRLIIWHQYEPGKVRQVDENLQPIDFSN